MSHRILVTGATGNIGGLLVPRLLDAGHDVRVLTRSADRLSRAWRERVEVVQGDATTASDLREALDAVEVALSSRRWLPVSRNHWCAHWCMR